MAICNEVTRSFQGSFGLTESSGSDAETIGIGPHESRIAFKSYEEGNRWSLGMCTKYESARCFPALKHYNADSGSASHSRVQSPLGSVFFCLSFIDRRYVEMTMFTMLCLHLFSN